MFMKILALRVDKIGDFITTLPAIYMLKKNFDAHITVCISKINESIAKECDFIDEIIIYKPKLAYLYSEFKRGKFDLSVTFFSKTDIAIALLFAGVKERYAPATKIAQIFYNHKVVQRRSQVKMSEFEYNIDLVSKIRANLDLSYPSPLFKLKPKEMLPNSKKKIVAFHVGFGGSSDANLSLDEYIELARMVNGSKSYRACFTFASGETKLHDYILKNSKEDEFDCYISKGSIYDFMEHIASCVLFVSTSTGTFHLASAQNIPTFTFFADTLFASSKRWKGIGDISLQNNYMLPIDDVVKRRNMFTKIKEDIFYFVTS